MELFRQFFLVAFSSVVPYNHQVTQPIKQQQTDCSSGNENVNVPRNLPTRPHTTLEANGQPINIYNYNYNTIDSRQDYQGIQNTTSEQNQYVEQHTSQQLTQPAHELPDFASLSKYFFKHKKRFVLGSIICSYSILCYSVVRGNYYLRRSDVWFAWKKGTSLEQLYRIPQEVIAQELLAAIQSHYFCRSNPINFQQPLCIFLRALELEQHQLRYYHKIYTWLSRLKIRFLFPFNRKRYEQIPQKLARLAYLESVFSSWIAQFNIVQSKKG